MKILKCFMLIVLTLALLCSHVSCSNTPVEEKNSDVSENDESVNNEESVETEEKLQPNLPEITFNGYEFRMLGKGTSVLHWQSKDLAADEYTGEPINDAVYERNNYVGSRFDVKFREIDVGNFYAQDAEVNISVQANTDDYDMVALMPERIISSFINKGYIIDLYTVPYMDLTQPWYDQNAIEQISIGHKLFCVTGAMLTMDDDATTGVFFNKNLAISNELPDLYELVKEGKWTIDKLIEFATVAANDTNGDGEMTAMEDTWGALSQQTMSLSLNSAIGKTLITKDENDLPVVNIYDEEYIAMYEKVLSLQNNWDITLYAEAQQGFSEVFVECMDVTFSSGRGLFNICPINRFSLFRDMEDDYGIVPNPKFDENQEEYYSFVNLWCSNSIAIPKTASDLERTGIIIEALSAESLYGLTDAYYETTLKSKEARDSESGQMLDLIFSNRIYDLANMFNWGNVYSVMCSLTGNQSKDIGMYASTMKNIEKKLNAQMKATIDKIVD